MTERAVYFRSKDEPRCEGQVLYKMNVKPECTRRNESTSLRFLVATLSALALGSLAPAEGRIADRSRIVKHRMKNGVSDSYRDNGRPIEGQSYRALKSKDAIYESRQKTTPVKENSGGTNRANNRRNLFEKEAPWKITSSGDEEEATDINGQRKLSSQLTGCCYDYQGYSAMDMCAYYGHDCESGETPSHDSGDDDCGLEGLSFIGLSFSVNSAKGNPYSYQLCDQFPMENIIDRNYDYVMSMDEDGWLVGGGYKTFDPSGKMPYIDSSHTELIRIGSMDTSRGGTSIEQVYNAMNSVQFSPFAVFPEYLKGGGGGHNSGDNDDGEDQTVPSSDVTMIVSVVCDYEDDSYCIYEKWLDDAFDALYNVGGGACMDDHDTDPHISMSRGVKFKSSYHALQYSYASNLEIAVWQAMYPYGVVIGSRKSASFPPGRSGTKQKVGYGNIYFFYDRANITAAFNPSSSMTDDQYYYSTLTQGDVSQYYEETTEISFDYSGSGGNDGSDWEHNPYSWKATMAMHDMTDGWDLPPNCNQEGETFLGIPLSRKSKSNLQSSSTFQNQFDFDCLIDSNYTYVSSFGTNHGWLIGESVDNGIGSIVDKDTSSIPLFYLGTTNVDMGGISLSQMIKVVKNVEFGTLYIKPAFVYVDDSGHLKLQFEADASSAAGYLYNTLAQQLGISWNYETPYNNLGYYTNCAMHAAGDRAAYGCGLGNDNTGGFCPQMTIAYSVRFKSEDYAAAYLEMANNYVDYWRSLYPTGVAVGWENFCPETGCLGLFLNRYDLYNVFKPDLGGSWVEYNGASMAPTFSPAPTWKGGCDEPMNFHLDKCFRKHNKPKATAVAWDSLGSIGQFSVFLIAFMATTLSVSIFLARARKRKRKNESYLAFFFRDLNRKRKRKKKIRRKTKGSNDMDEHMMSADRDSRSRRSRSKSASRSRSRSRRSQSRGASRGRSSRSSRSSSKRDPEYRSSRPATLQPSSGNSASRRDRSRNRSHRDYENMDNSNHNRHQLV